MSQPGIVGLSGADLDGRNAHGDRWAQLIAAAGVDVKLVVDFTHLLRGASAPNTLAALVPHLIAHVQICHGPASMAGDQIAAEATTNRLYPGEGAFPLRDLLPALLVHARLGIEAPTLARQQRGVTALERARQALRATRQILKDVDRAVIRLLLAMGQFTLSGQRYREHSQKRADTFR